MKKKQGFTLIELIVVLVIIGIIAGVTVPRYMGSFDSIGFRKTMAEMTGFLRSARINAMSTARKTNVFIDLHRGMCFNEEKKIFTLPKNIELFSDRLDALDEKTKIVTFYPNGTAREEKMGFVCDKMIAVLHVDPLGGMAYFKVDEKMEQVVRYARNDEPLSDEEMEKFIDKSKDSDTVTKKSDKKDTSDFNFEDEEDSDDEGGYFDEEGDDEEE